VKTQRLCAKCAKRSEPTALESKFQEFWSDLIFRTAGLELTFFFVFDLGPFSDFFSKDKTLFSEIRSCTRTSFPISFFIFDTILILKFCFCFSNTAFILFVIFGLDLLFSGLETLFLSLVGIISFFFNDLETFFFIFQTKFLSYRSVYFFLTCTILQHLEKKRAENRK